MLLTSLTKNACFAAVLSATFIATIGCSSGSSSGVPTSTTLPGSGGPWTGIKQLGVVGGTSLGTGTGINKITGDIFTTGYTTAGLDGNTNNGAFDYVVTKYNSSGVKQWTKQGGPASAAASMGSTVDKDGNVILVGLTYGDFDGQTGSGGQDMFIVKYNAAGVKQWTRIRGHSSGSTVASAVATDSNGDIVVAGKTSANLDGNTGSGSDDVFIMKFSAAGTWSSTLQVNSSAGGAEAQSAVFDSDNNYYVSGLTGAGATYDGVATSGNGDLFVTKFDSTGTKVWTVLRPPQGAGFVTSTAKLTVDVQKNPIVAGMIFHGGGDKNSFVYKLDKANGNDIWSHQLSTVSVKTSILTVTSDSSNNIILFGGAEGGVDGNSPIGPQDFLLIKYNSAGTRQWTKQYGGTGGSAGPGGIVTDTAGNIYSGSGFMTKFQTHDSIGTMDIMTFKTDSAGDLQ